MPDEQQLCLNIGQRLEYLGSYGTLKYVGEVPPTKGLWLGVDWDEPNRGKHNGTFEGKFYFETRFPRSGSFIRAAKINFGCDCVTAIHNRYGEVRGDETAGVDKTSLASIKKDLNASLFEVVGFDKVNKKQSQFDRLEVVYLRGENVSDAGLPGQLGQLCPQVREIDLSRNLLSSWQMVADICRQLPHLWMLTVSENRLSVPKEPTYLRDAFSNLKHIVASRMEYTWEEILTCCCMWQQLDTLQVPFNCISTINIPEINNLKNLKVLDLEGNPLCDWKEINQLGTVPNLQSLNVSNTGLTEIFLPSEKQDQKTDLFPNLNHLIISMNRISKWESVNELNKLRELEELRFQENPILEVENSETTRQLIIARLEKLQKLNGIQIVRTERKGAEYDYLKRHARQWLDIQKSPNKENQIEEFISIHPRYASLISEYGEPEEGEIKPMSTALKKQLINVEIISPDAGDKLYNKKLPLNMSVQKLVGLVQKLFNMGHDVPNLTYISCKHPDIEAPLDNQMKEIGFYSVEDGDRIVAHWK